MHKTLIVIGIIIVIVGLLWRYISKLPFGRLPGDIVIENENFKLYFAIVTMIVISLVISAILWLIRKF